MGLLLILGHEDNGTEVASQGSFSLCLACSPALSPYLQRPQDQTVTIGSAWSPWTVAPLCVQASCTWANKKQMQMPLREVPSTVCSSSRTAGLAPGPRTHGRRGRLPGLCGVRQKQGQLCAASLCTRADWVPRSPSPSEWLNTGAKGRYTDPPELITELAESQETLRGKYARSRKAEKSVSFEAMDALAPSPGPGDLQHRRQQSKPTAQPTGPM